MVEAGVPRYLWHEAFRMQFTLQIVSRPPRLEVNLLTRCGTVENSHDLSTSERLVPKHLS